MIPPSPAMPPQPDPAAARLRTAAEGLEAGFLAEMLTAAGLGQVPSAFGGGAGEDQFASFMIAQQASALVAAGGIGLAESLFAALADRADIDNG